MNPAQYWRSSKTWQKWLGKTGTVLSSSVVHVASAEFAACAPYSYALIDFGNEKHEFMGVDQEILAAGDQVQCVFRKMETPQLEALIPYGMKVQKIS